MNNSKTNRWQGSGCWLPLVILAAFVAFWIVGGALGIFSGRDPVPGYPNGRSSSLTSKGNQWVDSLYSGNKREGSDVKTFLTKDSPGDIIQYYRNELNKKGYAASSERFPADLPAGTELMTFRKGAGGFVLIVGSGQDELVNDQKKEEAYLIVIEGDF